MDVSFRQAVLEDCEGIGACIEEAYKEYVSQIPDLPRVSEGILNHVGNDLVWVAHNRQQILGVIIVIPHDEYAIVANIAVHPDHSGLGLGRSLMNLAEAKCSGLGLNELRLVTHVAMPQNISFYKGLSWVETYRLGNKVHMVKKCEQLD